MMASRKAVLDKNKQQLLDSVNASNKIYTNEELSILISELQNENKQLKEKQEIDLKNLKESTYTKEKVDELVNSSFTGYRYEINLTSGYNENIWYPVVGGFSSYSYAGYRRIRCISLLGESGRPSWSSHSDGFTVSVDVMSQAGGWGAQPARTVILANEHSYSGSTSPVGYKNSSEISASVFFLRGGGRYTIYTDYPTGFTTYTTKHVFNEQYNLYVEPLSSNPGITATTEVVTLK